MSDINNIEVYYQGKGFSLKVKKMSFFGKIRGLMFKRKKIETLLFNFLEESREPIHSIFVFFPFIALWLNDKNEIVEHKIVKPFAFFVRPERKFIKLIEIPLEIKDEKAQKLIKSLVGKERFKYK